MKLTNTHANIIVATMWGFASLFFFWSLYPYNPLKVCNDMEVLNENKTVCIGDTLIYEMEYISNSKITPTLDKTLVDGLIFHLSETRAYAPEDKKNIGIPQTVTASVVIPETAPEGRFYLHIDALYGVNPIRDITVSFKTEEFDIIKCE